MVSTQIEHPSMCLEINVEQNIYASLLLPDSFLGIL